MWINVHQEFIILFKGLHYFIYHEQNFVMYGQNLKQFNFCVLIRGFENSKIVLNNIRSLLGNWGSWPLGPGLYILVTPVKRHIAFQLSVLPRVHFVFIISHYLVHMPFKNSVGIYPCYNRYMYFWEDELIIF